MREHDLLWLKRIARIGDQVGFVDWPRVAHGSTPHRDGGVVQVGGDAVGFGIVAAIGWTEVLRLMKTTAELALLSEFASAILLTKFIVQEQQRNSPAPISTGRAHPPPINRNDVLNQLRGDPARLVPRTSRYGRSLRRTIGPDEGRLL